MRARKSSSTRPSISIRLAPNDDADLRFAALCLGSINPRRMVAAVVLEVIDMTASGHFGASPGKMLEQIRREAKAREACARVHERGIRNLPNSATFPAWIPLEMEERALISRISHQVRWSDSQVVLEALHAGIAVASVDQDLADLPDFIRIFRAVLNFNESEAASVREQINVGRQSYRQLPPGD